MISTVFILILSFNSIHGLFDNEINLECYGYAYKNVTLTAYYPDYQDADYKRAFMDKNGNKLMTLQEFIDDRSNYVTLAMDQKLKIPYGTSVCIPELNKHYGHRIRIQVRDTSSDLKGMGFKRADICVRSETDSYDLTVNRKITLVFEDDLQ